MKQIITIFMCVGLILALPRDLRSETYSLAVAENTIDTVVSEVIVRKAYDMLGHQVDIIRLPAKRALSMANSGAHSGDVQRIFSVADTYPNLIRIEPAINFIHGIGFVRQETQFKVKTWQDLENYRVGLILGIRFAETNVPKKSATSFHNYRDLAKALVDHEIDIGIYPLSNGIYQTALIGEDNIVPMDTPLARFDLYHYIHKNNAHLVESLSRIFTQFEQDGTLEKVRRRVLDISFKRAKSGLRACVKDYACYQGVWED